MTHSRAIGITSLPSKGLDLDAAVDELLDELAPRYGHLLRLQFGLGEGRGTTRPCAVSRAQLRAALRALRRSAL